MVQWCVENPNWDSDRRFTINLQRSKPVSRDRDGQPLRSVANLGEGKTWYECTGSDDGAKLYERGSLHPSFVITSLFKLPCTVEVAMAW